LGRSSAVQLQREVLDQLLPAFPFQLHTPNGGRFDQTKLRLAFNNIFDQHSITGDSITSTALTQSIAANGTSYTDPFTTTSPTPIAGGDNISVVPGRSVMLSVTFGLSPKR
jgi:iron complex outermembrane receptor protein